MAVWYCASDKWTAVTPWAALTAYSIGDIRRQLATPTVGEERVFRCTTAGTSLATEPAPWTLTKGGTTTEIAGPVWTEITGSSTYNSTNNWAAPHARCRKLAEWMIAGDTGYVGNHHAATEGAAVTILFPGTLVAPNVVTCVDDTNATPTATTGASETTTGTFALSVQGYSHIYGLRFNCSTGSAQAQLGINNLGAGNVTNMSLEECDFYLVNTHTSSRIDFGADGSATGRTDILNCRAQLNAAGQVFNLNRGTLNVKGLTAVAGAAAPTAPLNMNGCKKPVFDGCDWSAWASSLLLARAATGGTLKVMNGKMPAGWAPSTTLLNSAIPNGDMRLEVYNCDAGDTNYKIWIEEHLGRMQEEIVLVKTGGASDGDTPIAWKMTSGANAEYPLLVLRSPQIASKFITAVGVNTTITIDVAHGLAANLNDDEMWLEVQYLGQPGSPATKLPASFISDAKANVLSAAAAQASSAATWSDGSPPSERKQALSVTFVPQGKGVAMCTVCLAKPSVTVYVDPLAQVS